MRFHPILHEGGGPAPPPALAGSPPRRKQVRNELRQIGLVRTRNFGLDFPRKRRGNSEQFKLGFGHLLFRGNLQCSEYRSPLQATIVEDGDSERGIPRETKILRPRRGEAEFPPPPPPRRKAGAARGFNELFRDQNLRSTRKNQSGPFCKIVWGSD
jgi:hypothetical protein